MNNIKGIILDIDGVIVGEKIGFNSPNPHPAVIQALKTLHQNGVAISLCTGKPHFSIKQIIDDAQLDNLHITDGGGVIIDPIDKVIAKTHIIDTEVAKQVIQKYIDNNIYTEFYTTEGYFIQKNQESEITKGHTHVLQQAPILLDNLAKSSSEYKITKIMPIAKDENEMPKVIEIFKEFQNKLTLSWGVHPVILPLQFALMTTTGISKQQGAMDISLHSKIPFENMLGIGDSTSDRQFIQLCTYGAAPVNASQ
jgi:HAD superfamily hydrolase (TIGR01484 family)